MDSPRPSVSEVAAQTAAQREQFLALVHSVRPRLHRYCAKMVGSALDGEDLVQETLAHAFFRLSSLRDDSTLEAWLFRIAHNRTIDQLRRRAPTLEALSDEQTGAQQADTTQRVSEAMTAVVTTLPPKERASVVLKDVLGYELRDIAEIVDSTVGGVKAALHRGRAKLHATQSTRAPRRSLDEHQRHLVTAYVERFNRRDWDAVRDLLRADARLELVDRLELHGAEAVAANYFVNYDAIEAWRFAEGHVDGEPVVVQLRPTEDGTWSVYAALRLTIRDGAIAVIRDYVHVDGVVADADVVLA